MRNHANATPRECFWGDIAVHNSSQNIGDCNYPCDGAPTEICGGGNRILIYQDAEWVLLTNAEYAAELQELQALLQQLQTLVAKWHQDLQAYYKAIQTAAQKKRKRVSISLTQQGITLNLDRQAILDLLKPKSISKLLLYLLHSYMVLYAADLEPSR